MAHFKQRVLAKADWLLEKLLNREHLKQYLFRQQHYLLPEESPLSNTPSPYPTSSDSENTSAFNQSPAIFVSGRFRSGSTMFWNIFRSAPNMTCYYEPFNERQWFNPELRGDFTDSTHKGVTDYWTEYLQTTGLEKYFDEDWIRHDLLMDRRFINLKMRGYIDNLISQAKGHALLQFNRTDFRLPWLKHHYPNAKILHLYRNPRDQWLSTLHTPSDYNVPLNRFYDGYYLKMWSTDLAKHFPFITDDDEHIPYRIFYYIWKLSYLFGKKYADVSVSYEDLVTNPKDIMQTIISQASLPVTLDDLNLAGISPSSVGKANTLNDNSYFENHERHCERVLTQFFGHS